MLKGEYQLRQVIFFEWSWCTDIVGKNCTAIETVVAEKLIFKRRAAKMKMTVEYVESRRDRCEETVVLRCGVIFKNSEWLKDGLNAHVGEQTHFFNQCQGCGDNTTQSAPLKAFILI